MYAEYFETLKIYRQMEGRGGTTRTRERMCFVQGSYFVGVSTKNTWRSNSFLMLTSTVQSTPFNPSGSVSIYTAYWRNRHVMNNEPYEIKPSSKLGRENQ